MSTPPPVPSPVPKVTDRHGRPLRIWVIIASGIVVLTLLAWLYPPVRAVLTDGAAFREWVKGFGAWGPIITISFYAIQIIFPTIPGLVVDITNGYLYGVVVGLALSYAGIILGTIVALLIARRFGDALSEGLNKRYQTYFARFRGTKQLRVFLLIMLIPGMPHDILTYVIGVTHHSLLKKLGVMLLGRLPTVLLAIMLGAHGRSFSPLTAAAASVIFFICLGLVFSLVLKKRRTAA